MPRPKGKGAGRARRPAKGKAAKAKARRPKKPKAKAKRPKKPAAARKAKPVAAKKKKVVAPAKPARKAERAVAGPKAAAPKPTPPIERKGEDMAKEKTLTPDQFLAEILTPEYSKASGHVCWDCKHFKPVQKGSKFPPKDTIGWCTQIHWPFFWCITDFNVVKKCYAFEKGVYAPFQPARFPS